MAFFVTGLPHDGFLSFMIRPDLHEANRLSWNAATAAHNLHKADQAAFHRGGGTTLFDEEIDLLGDVRGTSVLHLLCNSGQDTLGLAALGAEATGVDISDEAIRFARGLSTDTGIVATFERADVYSWLDEAIAAGRTFDTVFCSYGALGWLSDLDEWLRLVAAVLKPGGRFVCMEFHPVAFIFDPDGKPAYDYTQREPFRSDDGINDYVGESDGSLSPSGLAKVANPFQNPHPAYDFQRGLGELFTAVLQAGLEIRTFREHCHSNGWKCYKDMEALPGRRWTTPAHLPKLPLMYGLVARKR